MESLCPAVHFSLLDLFSRGSSWNLGSGLAPVLRCCRKSQALSCSAFRSSTESKGFYYSVRYSRDDKNYNACSHIIVFRLDLRSSHFSYENPDEPESACEQREGCVQDEVPESILLRHDSFLSFYYMVRFSCDIRKTITRDVSEGLPLKVFWFYFPDAFAVRNSLVVQLVHSCAQDFVSYHYPIMTFTAF